MRTIYTQYSTYTSHQFQEQRKGCSICSHLENKESEAPWIEIRSENGSINNILISYNYKNRIYLTTPEEGLGLILSSANTWRIECWTARRMTNGRLWEPLATLKYTYSQRICTISYMPYRENSVECEMVMRSHLYINIYIYTFIFYFILRGYKKEWYLRSWKIGGRGARRTTWAMLCTYVNRVLRIHIGIQRYSRSVGICEFANMHWDFSYMLNKTLLCYMPPNIKFVYIYFIIL